MTIFIDYEREHIVFGKLLTVKLFLVKFGLLNNLKPRSPSENWFGLMLW